MRRIVFGLGAAQVLLTMGAVLLAAVVVGGYFRISLGGAFALGAALAMSSTAIVMKLLSERMQLDTEHGRRIVGVLLFQDLAVVPLLVVIPALAADPGELGRMLGLAVLKAAALLVLLLVGGQQLMRWWLRLVAARRSHELFTLNVLLVTLGLAWLTEVAGLSRALGAFIAGMLIAETEFRHQVEEDIKPFRDVLLGLFFVTTGMLLNPHVVIAHPGWVLFALALPVGFKFGLIHVLTRAFGAGTGTALRTALALATAGEFGFVLLAHAGQVHLLDDLVLQIVLAAMLLSMLAAPLLVHHSDPIVLRLAASEWMQKSLEIAQIAQRAIATDRHVVICGFGRSGQHLAKMLDQEKIGYVALDLDPDLVRQAAAAGDSVVYGDAARRETLVSAGIRRAAALVITYADTTSALKVLRNVQELKPGLPVIVRTQDEADLDRLMQAGATEVVPEVLEGSLMLGSQALVLLGVPVARVIRRVRATREQRYRLLRGHFHGAGDLEETIEEASSERLHSVMLDAGAAAVNRAIADLGLAELGVVITAVRRGGVRSAEPGEHMVLQSGDVVVMRGVSESLELAEQRLLSR